MREAKVDMDESWRLAAVIVTNNPTRDAINVRATEAFAERTGRALNWYESVDMFRKSIITDSALVESLESQHSGQTKHRLRRLPLVMGMPVAINRDFDVKAGVVNGSGGFLKAVRSDTGGDGKRRLKSCVVELPGTEDVQMKASPAKHFPTLPDTT